jgi:2-C-methyl-D-erythritol 2,4-cyclodiphosphate synthase
MRIGMGYDIHKLVPGRRLILGGVEIPFERGLLGHSDADVLIHAVCDALLGAAGLGDIGLHFPDTDPAYKDIDSMILLDRTGRRVRQKGLAVVNVDATVFAQAPRLAPFKIQMAENMGRVLGIDSGCVNVKATSTEGLGMIGAGEGIAAMAVALLREEKEGDVIV